MANDDTSVRVALRIRPQVPSEVIDMCRICTAVTPGEPQVTLGQDKAFTFDHVFDTAACQQELFDTCVAALVNASLDGYNATVLAYGQTGSGKTYTMGTGFEVEDAEGGSERLGVLPRALSLLFEGVEERVQAARGRGHAPPEFRVLAQFMELYNEEIIDLFDPARDHYGGKLQSNGSRLRIHEDAGGGVSVAGATCKPVRDATDALQCLRLGALARTTAATNMNAASSRSHAVFTLHIRQRRLVTVEDEDDVVDTSVDPPNEFETLTAKFHFVDLAGSERLKRTGATGERAREGISINCGLLALGNVISALGDKSKRVTHIPYRDSKLTRLLQDSLGGNSQTLMIACVSPSDRDFMETLNTLKYANRARNIKNRICINQDKSSRTITLLRQEVAQLQLELLEFKQGKRIVSENGEDGINDMYHENTVLQSELNNLRTRVKAMQATIDQLSQKNSELLAEKAMGVWTRPADSNGTELEAECSLTVLIQGYVKEIEELRAKLLEANNMYEILKKNVALKQHNMSKSLILSPDVSLLDTSSTILNEAKKELYKEKEMLARSMGDVEFSRKLSHSESHMGERERAEGESADETDNSDQESDSDDESEESEESKVCAVLGTELTSLSGEIDTKQRLIEELELSQRRLHSLRRHYEDKLALLHTQILLTQDERDKVLASYGNQMSQPSDKVKRVKEDYERKLGDMQRELRRLQLAQKEHNKLLRSQTNTDNQIRAMKNELTDMKRTKVKLLNKMKEESQRHKQAESVRNREIAQLRKESRRNANTIRSLEAEKRLKEQVLRRKQEEVTALRKGHKQGNLSLKAAGRKQVNFSMKSAKHKWHALEKTISKVTLNKQAMGSLERDMERHLSERESLTKELERLRQRRIVAMRDVARPDALTDVENEIDNVNANIEYLQESIAETQHQIMQFEESKESGEDSELTSLLAGVRDVAEARYLLDKLYHHSLGQAYSAVTKDLQLKDSQAKLHEVQMASERNESLLRLVIDTGVEQSHPSPHAAHQIKLTTNFNHISSGTSTRSVSPVDSSLIELAARNDAKNLSKRFSNATVLAPNPAPLPVIPITRSNDVSPNTNPYSNITLVPTKHPSPTTNAPTPFQRGGVKRASVRLREIGVIGSEDKDRNGKDRHNSEDIMTQSMIEPSHRGQPLARVPSAPGALKGLVPIRQFAGGNVSDLRASPAPTRKPYLAYGPGGYTPAPTLHSPGGYSPVPHSPGGFVPVLPLVSPRLGRRSFALGTPGQPLLGKPGSIERGEKGEDTPPGSPPARRRDEDVFCRLAGPGQYGTDTHGAGLIREYQGKSNLRSALQCSWVAEGHNNAVLSLAVTEDQLFSASADRTVKVWDLTMGRETSTLGGHPNSVVAVRYHAASRLLFSVSSAYVRVWDLRCDPHRALKTLCSSGITQSSAGARAAQLPAGECPVTDAALSPRQPHLYTASNDKVRIWDLRKLECVGKVSSGHQAAVMCLTVGAPCDAEELLITGSKDHYVKVISMGNAVGGVTAASMVRLEPPHYDGVQSLALSGRSLFTGSRDTALRKWDLHTQELQHCVNGAHKGWVTGVARVGEGAVASVCRGGRVRVWCATSCRPLAHASVDDVAINALATNQQHIFTASNDGKIRFWRLRLGEAR